MGRGRAHQEKRFVVIQTTNEDGDVEARMQEVPLEEVTTIELDEVGVTVVAMPLGSVQKPQVELRCRSQCHCSMQAQRCLCGAEVIWVPEDNELHEVLGCQLGVFNAPKLALRHVRSGRKRGNAKNEQKLFVVVTDGKDYEVYAIPVGKRRSFGPVTYQAQSDGVVIWSQQHRGLARSPLMTIGHTHKVNAGHALEYKLRVFTDHTAAQEWAAKTCLQGRLLGLAAEELAQAAGNG